MDYTQQSLRELIYRDRNSIDDFDVNDPESLDAEMLKRIEDSMIVELEGASRYILEIFNNAYYITTLILMEPHPVHYLYKYLMIASHAGSAYEDVSKKNTYHRYFESITMAMVWNYLCACLPDKYDLGVEDSLLKSIWDYHYKHFNDTEWDGSARFLFFDNVMIADEIQEYRVRDKFMPLHSPEQLKAIEDGTLQPEDTLNNEKIAELEEIIKLKDKTIEKLKKRLGEELAKKQKMADEEQVVEMLSELESIPILKLLWYLMKLDGANVQGHGKRKLARNIMANIAKIPFDTTKQIWAHENKSVTRQEDLLIKLNHWMESIGMKYRF